MGARRSILLLLLVSWLVAGCEQEPREANRQAATVEAEPAADGTDAASRALAADPRLSLLLAPCAESGPYLVDTADPVAILIENLERGRLDPLKAAKAELAACGEPCLEQVRRSLERHWNHPDGTNFVRNALDVAYLADGETARELVVRGLSHPNGSLRNVALRALTKHGRASEYDHVLELLNGAGEATWKTGIPLLHELDPDRAEAQYLAWIEQGFFEQGWELFAPRLAGSTRPETVAFARANHSEVSPALRPFLTATAARAGDERALADLRAMLRDLDQPTLRGLALTAVRQAELWDELEWSLLDEPYAPYRVVAAEGVAQAPRTEERDGLLRAASNDPDPGVRALCLRTRLERGDAAAKDLALANLTGETVSSLETQLDVLRAAWKLEPELADRAAEILIARAESKAHRPITERASLLHTLGLVPCRSAAAYLVEAARTETGELQKLPVHRWLLLRAGNTGAPGQAYLIEQLAQEHDPVRRLDYLEALSATGGESARNTLLDRIEDPETHPYEAVYVAERLVRLGPTEAVLPALKRAALRMQDYSARTALNCLLWTWYPEPR